MNQEYITEKAAEIEEFAGLLYTPEKVAVICDIEEDDLRLALHDKKHAWYKAYFRGYLKTDAEVRRSVLTHAKAGSSPAQQMAMKFVEEININML